MKTNYHIVVLPGDGIGPEIICEARKVIEQIAKRFNHQVKLSEALIGGAAIDATGAPISEATVNLCKSSDATLKGGVGGPKWDDLPANQRPEKGLMRLRKEMRVFANLRPVKLLDALQSASYVHPKILKPGLDIMILRELTGDAYFGTPRGEEVRNGERVAFNTMIYSESEVRRIALLAFQLASKRNKRVCSVDKANVLEVSRLWRRVVIEVAKNFPDVELSHLYVDNASMQLIRNPYQFDVILTSNIFGDILSDEASQLTGSIGMLPSASLGESGPGFYEAIHGSAPDIAGQDKANPLGTILSIAMLYRHSLDNEEVAQLIEKSVDEVLKQGWRTSDIMEQGKKLVGCKRMGELVLEQLAKSN